MKRESALHIVKPAKDERVGLMNPDFQYVRAAETDIRKTFDRIRREQAKKGKKA